MSSCSQCNRPLAVDSTGGLCEVCLATAVTMDVRSESSEKKSAASNTLTQAPPAVVLPKARAAQYGSTFTAAGRTHTAPVDSFEFQPHLPEPPPGYDLLHPLGSGGMGRVYLAREHAAERVLAIKFLNAPSSSAAFDRFLVEVRAQAKLKHPHIVEVIAVEVNWREPFFTMEYAAEGSLAERAKPGPMPPAEAARLVMEAAEGVAYAHANHVLHRDLKPSNILLHKDSTGELHAKVSDFGLAKRTDRDEGLTQTGLMGTASYMSPEAAAGRFRDIGPASDVYGLGATLYHLITGRPPFSGEDNQETVKQVLNDPVVRPRSLCPDLPAKLEAIAMKALEKEPARRYASAAAFGNDLKAYLAGATPAAPILTTRRRLHRWFERNLNRIALAVGAVLLAMGLVVAGRNLGDKDEPAPKETDPVAAIQTQLRRGETVTLVGETGMPRTHRFWLGPASLGDSPLNDGTCAFDAFDTRLLELLPDPGIERYTVSLEIRHLLSRLAPLPKGIETDAVGFYFGHVPTTSGEVTVHPVFGAVYKDYQFLIANQPPRPAKVFFQWQAILQIPDRVPEGTPLNKANDLPFQAKPMAVGVPRAEPGEWRKIVAEFSPDRVHVQWRNDQNQLVTLARYTGKELSNHYESLRKDVSQKAPSAAAAMPEWSPRMGFGVVSYRASVALRNVTITPSP